MIDYTHYNNGGGYITYYLCSGNVYDLTDVNNCYDPTKQYTEDTTATRTTHEFRFTTDQTNRWRLLGGIYANTAEYNHIGDFQYAASNPAFAEHISSYYNNDSGAGFMLGNTSLPTDGTNAVGPRSPFTTFFNDFTREVEEVGGVRRGRLRPHRQLGGVGKRSPLRSDIAAGRAPPTSRSAAATASVPMPERRRTGAATAPTSATT